MAAPGMIAKKTLAVLGVVSMFIGCATASIHHRSRCENNHPPSPVASGSCEGIWCLVDATPTHDRDGDSIDFEFTFSSVPRTSLLQDEDIISRFGRIATFSPDEPGEYVVKLSVTDGCRRVDHFVNIFYAEEEDEYAFDCAGNHSPVAKARVVHDGKWVWFDGKSSYDVDHDAVHYLWSFFKLPRGSLLSDDEIRDPLRPYAGIMPDIEGTYEVALSVHDSCGASSSTRVQFQFGTSEDHVQKDCSDNHTPSAVVRSTVSNGVISLDATSSHDDDGDSLDYFWSLSQVPVGSSITDGDIIDRDMAVAEIFADVSGTYKIGLVVSDGCSELRASAKAVYMDSGDSACEDDSHVPRAHILYYAENGVVVLDGASSSDEKDEVLDYRWSFISVPNHSDIHDGSIIGQSTSQARFKPDMLDRYIVALDVKDACGRRGSTSATLSLDCDNLSVPEARATYAFDGDLVLLDGSRSRDSSSSIGEYAWTIHEKPDDSEVTDATIVQRGPTAHFHVDKQGSYVVGLEVSDACHKDSTTVTINVSALLDCKENLEPKAVLEFSYDESGEMVLLDGSLSTDNDGPIVEYRWILNERPDGSRLGNEDIMATGATAEFVPDVGGRYQVKLMVSDACDSGSMASVEVDAFVGNKARCQHNHPPYVGAAARYYPHSGLAILDATTTSDPDDDELLYRWTILQQPKGSNLKNTAIVAATKNSAAFQPIVEGTYKLKLWVSDMCGQAGSKVLVFSTNAQPQVVDELDED